jgi:hypothetical protein
MDWAGEYSYNLIKISNISTITYLKQHKSMTIS